MSRRSSHGDGRCGSRGWRRGRKRGRSVQQSHAISGTPAETCSCSGGGAYVAVVDEVLADCKPRAISQEQPTVSGDGGLASLPQEPM